MVVGIVQSPDAMRAHCAPAAGHHGVVTFGTRNPWILRSHSSPTPLPLVSAWGAGFTTKSQLSQTSPTPSPSLSFWSVFGWLQLSVASGTPSKSVSAGPRVTDKAGWELSSVLSNGTSARGWLPISPGIGGIRAVTLYGTPCCNPVVFHGTEITMLAPGSPDGGRSTGGVPSALPAARTSSATPVSALTPLFSTVMRTLGREPTGGAAGSRRSCVSATLCCSSHGNVPKSGVALQPA